MSGFLKCTSGCLIKLLACAACYMNFGNTSIIFITDQLQEMFKTVRFSAKGTTARSREEAEYIMFVRVLNECEG